MIRNHDGSVTLTAVEFESVATKLMETEAELERALMQVRVSLTKLGLREPVEAPLFTIEAQDMLAEAIKRTVDHDGGIKHLDDPEARGSRLRAISRMTQSIADIFSGKFDRKRFVEKTGFSGLEGF